MEPKLNNINNITEHLFREFYQEVFSSLVIKFGTQHVELIEDALQESFYKALKSWRFNNYPKNPKGWLFTVAKNQIINHLKRFSKTTYTLSKEAIVEYDELEKKELEDDQLNLLVACTHFDMKPQAKLVFTLKAICGFGVSEISNGLQITEENVYKLVQRGKRKLKKLPRTYFLNFNSDLLSDEIIIYLEQIIYFMFNEGYDTVNRSSTSAINEDICFEAVRLADLLEKRFKKESTKNLLALCYFHMARFESRFNINGSFISLRKQDRSQWDAKLVQIGFNYLTKPNILNRYYIEALIASIHLQASSFSETNWNEILKLYDILLEFNQSPIINLNKAICLFELKREEEARKLLELIKNELEDSYVYYSVSMAEYLKNKDENLSDFWYQKSLRATKQSFRKEIIGAKLH